MKPFEKDVKILDQLVAHIHLLTERNGILTEKLNLDYYEFEVSKGKVQGICLYYSNSPIRIQHSKNVWYTRGLSPISLQTPRWQQTLPGYLKLLMGNSDWYKDQHHLRMIGQAKPVGFYGARMACHGEPYAVFFKMPRNTRLYRCSPQPMECYADDSRLNLLFVLTTMSPDYQPRSLDLSYDISEEPI
jgi:hypothetical protein